MNMCMVHWRRVHVWMLGPSLRAGVPQHGLQGARGAAHHRAHRAGGDAVARGARAACLAQACARAGGGDTRPPHRRHATLLPPHPRRSPPRRALSLAHCAPSLSQAVREKDREALALRAQCNAEKVRTVSPHPHPHPHPDPDPDPDPDPSPSPSPSPKPNAEQEALVKQFEQRIAGLRLEKDQARAPPSSRPRVHLGLGHA